MGKERKLKVQESAINVITQNEIDFISLTDMTTSFKEGSGLIGKWITNKNTIEYLGVWEKVNNPDFNYPEFGVIGLEQLVVLSNMESINALLINQGLPQNERLIQLNKVAITQMRSLLENDSIKKIK